jgi:vacuolar protein sorting-associated protein 45
MFLNLGDLGANIKSYVDEYQTKTKSNMNIESIADMKRFVEDYPEFRKLSGNVSKHVTLVGELSRLVDQGNVLEVSELEQSLACTDAHNNDLKVQTCLAIRGGFKKITNHAHLTNCSAFVYFLLESSTTD